MTLQERGSTITVTHLSITLEGNPVLVEHSHVGHSFHSHFIPPISWVSD